ncbi:MAG: hypothetical protein P8Y85_04500 [Nitrospirota bacterium]|jgi:hypothetical protein
MVPAHNNESAALKDENKRIKLFRFLTDLTAQRLYVERLTLAEAWNVVADLRKVSENIFPSKGYVFDLVIAPRMERIIRERFLREGRS